MSRPAKFLLIAALVSLVALVASALLVWSWRSELPDPVAVHWSGSGVPDGFASLEQSLALLTGTITAAVLFISLVGWAVTRNGAGVRFTVGVILYLGALGALLQATTAASQRGFPSAQDSVLPHWWLMATLIGPALPALLGALLMPRTEIPDATQAPPADAGFAPLEDGQVPHWQGGTDMGTTGMLVLSGVVAGTGVWIAVLMASWAVAVGAVILAGSVLSICRFTITADATGVSVRSWFGWPAKRVDSAKISWARPERVQPLGEFGG